MGNNFLHRLILAAESERNVLYVQRLSLSLRLVP